MAGSGTLSKSQDTLTRMTTEPVGKLIMSLAVPTVISMLVTNLYNTADTFFVSQLGNSASGAVGIIFSIMAVIQAIGFTIGMGSGSIISRAIGSKDIKTANTYSSSGLIFSFTLGSLIAVVGCIFQDTIITKLGATETILPYAKSYAQYILIGTPFMATSFVMNNQLRFQGKAKYGMIGLTTGGILNIALDPLFIFVFGFGISGAAIATLISQCISFSILLSMFIRKKTITELSVKNIALKFKVYYEIFSTGMPSLFRQGMASVAMIFLNTQARFFGATNETLLNLVFDPQKLPLNLENAAADATIAAMAITNRFFMLIMSVAIGLGQGFQPVCGMNYGAGRYDRVKQAFYFLVKICAALMGIFMVSILVFAPEIAGFFRDSSAVIYVASTAMRAQAIALPLMAFVFGINMTLQTTGHKKAASFTSILRQGIFFIPLILVLPQFMGVLGIQLAQAISDILSAMTVLPFGISFFRNLPKEEKIS